jgi:hypothetical protein
MRLPRHKRRERAFPRDEKRAFQKSIREEGSVGGNMSLRGILLLALAFLSGLGAANLWASVPGGMGGAPPPSQILLKGEVFQVAVAETGWEKVRGLKFRGGMGGREGMLFVFWEEGFHPFWMKDVLFPLDILWLDGNFRIVSLVEEAPPCGDRPCSLSYRPQVPALYVLEVPGGTVGALGVQIGDPVASLGTLPRLPR